MATGKRTLKLVQFSLLLAIEAVFCFYPPLGSIPIGPMVATLAHIPVIVTAIVLGLGPATAMGALTGLFSFLVWTFSPPNPLLAFVYTPFYPLGPVQGNGWSLVICFVPRILIGVVAALVYEAVARPRRRLGKSEAPAYILAGISGSLANTLGVLGGIYVFFGRGYAAANALPYELLLGAIGAVVATNGMLEAAVAALVAVGVGGPVRKVTNR